MLLVNQDHGKKNPRTDNFCHLTSTHPAMTVHSPCSFQAGFHVLMEDIPSQGGFLFPLQSFSHWHRQVRNYLEHRVWGGSKRDREIRGSFWSPSTLQWSQNPGNKIHPCHAQICSSFCANGGLRDGVRFNQGTTVSHFQDQIQEECCASLWGGAHHETSIGPLLHSKD